MATKGKKRAGGSQANKKPSAKDRRKKAQPPSQTNKPSKQDVHRRIGQHEGVGKPPLMKK